MIGLRVPVLAIAVVGCLSFMLRAGGQETVDEAVSLAISGEYEEALKLFRSELASHPGSSLLHYYVGMTEFRLGNDAIARVHLEQSVASGAEFPQAFFWYARMLADFSSNEEAKTVLGRGLERFPLNKDLRDLAQSLKLELPKLPDQLPTG